LKERLTMITNRMRRWTRPQLTLPLVSLLVGGSLILSQPAKPNQAVPLATAAPTCSLKIPTKVAIYQAYQAIALNRGDDCKAAGVFDALWDGKRPDGVLKYQAILAFDEPDFWLVFHTDSLSVYTWHPSGARAYSDVTLATDGRTAATPPIRTTGGQSPQATTTTVPQNTPTTDVRLGSSVGILASGRSDGTGVTITARAHRWAITPAAPIVYAGASGSIQYRPNGGSTWTVLTSFTLNSNGEYPYTYKPTQLRDYRVVVYDAQYIFGGISATWTK
jgi:hypothetical protein